ncbi:SusC/RagA family TonB-linked outer membrane protein [Filimonas effusa]|nr:SusC/RagA family TonB-linked outer membrane protein [Filimonas effusa]
MRLSFILMLAGSLHVYAAGFGQMVSLEAKNTSLEKIFTEIRKQTGRNFLYSDEDLALAGKVDVSLVKKPLTEALNALLENTPLSYQIVNQVVVIKKKEVSLGYLAPPPAVVISGRVVTDKGEGIAGASVVEEGTKNGTVTSTSGAFTLRVTRTPVTLVFISLGYKRKAIENVTGGSSLSIVMESEAADSLSEVVISNGMFSRKLSSYTGAVSTFTQKQLATVSNQNVLKAVAILDPSFQIVDNLNAGSNPNTLPDIQLRGQTGIADVQGTYTSNPNLPLFILDGFETTLEKVNDMNMNLIASITILKDASAKAIYGSKAGNGVVVIETKAPTSGQLRLSYSGNFDVTAPDLSSYKLTNSMQKIEAEVLAGRYSSPIPLVEAGLVAEYAQNLQAALSGVNTYWLSQPLRNAIGQRHGLVMEGGEGGLRYSANMNFTNVAGVMKGSDRRTISGGVNLIYRKNKVQFRNSLTIDKNHSQNSPYGSFTNFAQLNPYWKMTDENGNYIKTYNVGSATLVGNPMYDGSLNSKDYTAYTNIIENFYADWDAAKNLRLTARIGYNGQINESHQFIPASNSRYVNISPTLDTYLDRGQYTLRNGKQNMLNADVLANYALSFGLHHLYLNGAWSLNTSTISTNGMTMVGFPNDKMNDISFGRRYADGSKAVGTENTSRAIALTSAISYSYNERYLVDLSYRGNASSQFGADKKWGLFWSAGLGWNVHREAFMNDLNWVNLLKFRASTGTTGTQNFNSYQSLATYQYITDRTYNGDIGIDLMALPNPALQWQQVKDNNFGVDLGLFNKLSLRFDYYIRDTKDLLSDMIVAPSNGFSTYKSNIGESRNKGFQLGLNMILYSQSSTRTNLSFFANLAHNTNKITKVSNSLVQLNRKLDARKDSTTTGAADQRNPSTRYEPGQSMNAIWVVQSKGIDPANGKEIFVKKDGSLTYNWSSADYIVGGDANPLYNGTFGFNFMHKGFTANFAFAYRWGGQQYNTTLVSRVENADFAYNVDLRALTERWKKPGDQSLYKDIAVHTDTKPTTRFVQDLNELLFSSVSVGYDFGNMRWIRRMGASRMNFMINMNDLGRISSVKTERGLDYPFARTISGSLQITF